LRQIIGVIRQVRDLTSDVTRQFNDEFGDLADLDPRRQITKALHETTSDIKEATKPVNKALNKPTAKTTPNTAAKPATTPKPTPKPTAAAATTDVAVNAEESVNTAEMTAAAVAKAASAAQNTGDVSDSEANVSAEAVQGIDSVSSDKGESNNGEEKPAVKPLPTPKQPSTDDQISPASAYFANKTAQPSAENVDKPKSVTTTAEDDLPENTIAPPPAARQTPPKDVNVSRPKPADEQSADKPVDEAAAEEKSL
jgi:hypothetical protein